MKAMRRNALLAALVLAVLAGSLPVPAAAQPVGVTATERRAGSQESYQPPVMKFEPQGLSLEEAVRLTLQHDPGIRLQQSRANFQTGMAQERTGLFDVSFLGNLQYNYRLQELTENRKLTERDKRDSWQQAVTQGSASAQSAEDLVVLLRRARDGGPGSDAVRQVTQLSPTVGGQLEILDNLIARALPDQRQELMDIRNNYIMTTLLQSEQFLEGQLSFLDVARQTLRNLGPAPDDEVFYDGRVSLQFNKLFRSGISVTPFVDGSLEGANYRGKLRSAEFGGKGLQDLFTFNLGTSFTVPLGRGRGARAVAALERSAVIERDASQLAALHQASVGALGTARAYWNLRGAQDTVDVLSRSLEMQQRLVELTRGLIEADELPASELPRILASQARAQARKSDANRRLHEARVALVVAMGLGASEDDATLPRASDQFPAVPDAAHVRSIGVEGLTQEALEIRQDVEAAALRREAGRVMVQAASSNLRPRIDLVASTWYTALEERTISQAIDRWVGPSTSLALQLERPMGNNFLRGQLLQREADAEQREIASADLQRQVKLRVVRASRSLEEAVARVQQAEEAARHYRATVEAEVERLRSGEVTLLDTVLTEQQATESLLAVIAARQDLAQLVAELRFEAGSLLADGAVMPLNLVTLPEARRSR
jgi:outer membrane protein TolC